MSHLSKKIRILAIVSLCIAQTVSFTCADTLKIPQTAEEKQAALDEMNRESLRSATEQRQGEEAELLAEVRGNDMALKSSALAALISSEREKRLPANQGVNLLLELLNDQAKTEQEQFQQQVISGFVAYPKESKVVVERLINILLDSERELFVRIAAADTINVIDPENPQFIQACIVVLDSDFTDLVSKAVNILMVKGSTAKNAVLPLIKLLDSPLPDIPVQAYAALGHIVDSTEATQTSLAEQVKKLKQFDSLPAEKGAALLYSLQALGEAAQTALPSLIEIYRGTTQDYVRNMVIIAMASLRPGSNIDAIHLLTRIITDGNDFDPLVGAAEGALLQIQPGDTEAIKTLALNVRHPQLRVRLSVATVIEKLGASAAITASALVSSLKDAAKKPSFNVALVNKQVRALYSIAPSGNFGGGIIDLLNPQSSFIKKANIRYNIQPILFATLAKVGVPDDRAVQAEALSRVIEGLQSDSIYVFASAARVAGEMGELAAPSVPYILTALEPMARDAMMTETFGASMMPIVMPWSRRQQLKLSLPKHHSMPAGHNLIHDRYSYIVSARMEAIRALTKIGMPAAAPAIPYLERIVKEDAPLPYHEVARDALFALGVGVRDQATVLPGATTVVLNKEMPEVIFTDLQANTLNKGNISGKMNLFVFVDTQCPCVQAYTDRMKALNDKYEAKGLNIIYVFALPEEKKETISKFVIEQKLPWTIVQDTKQELTNTFDAQSTSESFLFDQKGVLRYHGRIDDNIYKPEKVKERNLENAIVALLNAKPVATAETELKTCVIPRM